MSALAFTPSLTKVLTTTLFAVTVCAICNTVDMVIPCHECHRSQCMSCFSPDPKEPRCEGCRMEHLLGVDSKQAEEAEEAEQAEEEYKTQEDSKLPGDPFVFERLPFPVNPEQPLHLIEQGTMPFHGIPYPSLSHWKQVEHILEGHIQFTTSSMGIQKPQLNTRYLVGRTHHIYPNRALAMTDYLMSYEQNPRTNTYEWRHFMATYYHQSPIPHDVNLFYPYPLPLQFE